MNIAWFTHRDMGHPQAGGVGRTIHEVGKRLAQRGHSFNVVSVGWKESKNLEEIDGIYVRRLRNNLIAHLYATKLLKEISPDIVVDDLGHAVPWFSDISTSQPGTVFFHHLHRRSLKGQVSLPLRYVISGIELLYPIIYRTWPFVTESISSFDDLVNLGIDESRITRILPGVDTDFYKPRDKEDAPTIVYFGGFRDYKRPWEVIYCVKDLFQEFDNLRLVMIGSGPSLDKTKGIAKSLGLYGRISFLGKISDMELVDVVSGSWLNIHTSTTEGYGFSILEASACGVPTIAYAVPGIIESIENANNGFLIQDGNRKQMGETIANFLRSYESSWVKKSRNVALKYSWNETANQWEGHLWKTIERNY